MVKKNSVPWFWVWRLRRGITLRLFGWRFQVKPEKDERGALEWFVVEDEFGN